MLDRGLFSGKAQLRFGAMVVRAAREVVAVRVCVAFNWERLWALAITVGKAHVGAAAQ